MGLQMQGINASEANTEQLRCKIPLRKRIRNASGPNPKRLKHAVPLKTGSSSCDQAQAGSTRDVSEPSLHPPVDRCSVTNTTMPMSKALPSSQPLKTPSPTDSKGRTALMAASNAGHEPMVRIVLAWGADVNQTTANGHTALMAAANSGHEAVLQVLIAGGAEVNQMTLNGTTALMYASNQGHRGVVNLLLQAGAAVNQARADGSTAMTAACHQGHKDVMRDLRTTRRMHTSGKLSQFNSAAANLAAVDTESQSQV